MMIAGEVDDFLVCDFWDRSRLLLLRDFEEACRFLCCCFLIVSFDVFCWTGFAEELLDWSCFSSLGDCFLGAPLPIAVLPEEAREALRLGVLFATRAGDVVSSLCCCSLLCWTSRVGYTSRNWDWDVLRI